MSDLPDQPELIFDFSPNGRAAGTTVTAHIGDELLGLEKFDLCKSKSRADFAASICKDRPGIEREGVERVLVQQAAEFAARESKQKQEPTQLKSGELLERMPETVRIEARAMLEDERLLERVLDE
jgi:hypothetical protein